MPKSEAASRKNIAAEVLDFYESLPFNMRDSVAEAVKRLKNHDPVDSYPLLKGILKKKTVLEVGCGVG